jgi:hypothetical protein
MPGWRDSVAAASDAKARRKVILKETRVTPKDVADKTGALPVDSK